MNREDETLAQLQGKNPHLKLYSIHDRRFKSYGAILNDLDVSELIGKMAETPIPEAGNIYLAAWDALEQTACKADIANCVFGGLDTQVGYCNGVNSFLNGLEYHKTSELNVAVTDLVLLLGHHTDIEENQYRTADVEAFYVPAGNTFEVFAGTLHYGPCKVVSSGFKCVVALQNGTNLPLERQCSAMTGTEQQLLFRRNKWLLVHPSREVQIREGAYPGIVGENTEVYTIG
ncbi:DUF4867 family protein [Alicyclobacillus mengziensis]|uniref:DUF4867 family protein n=1 Tax=Alicyclobacillus mengziensis TaxID=2931921 RepID=A0A9X7Z864_9BACL|nr:DUF4867 family protein [Alicyclobacillus mengziensis]QSO49292.1 DUF4867 family protein [Alicyclobacillus mengziensis]